MKTKLLFYLLCIVQYSIGQTLPSEYLFTNGSLENSANNTPFTQTGTALTFNDGIENTSNNGVALNGDVLNNPAWVTYSGADDFDYTIAFWIKTSDNSATEKEIINNFTTYGWRITLINGSIKVYGKFFTQGTTSSNQPATHTYTSSVIADGNWHFIVLTLDKYATPIFGTPSERSYVRYKTYIDNVLVRNVEIQKINVGNHYAVPGGHLYVGDNKDLNGNRYTDAIDNIRYYNGLLSTAQMTTLYNELQTLGIDDITISDTIKIYPNPVSEVINIKTGNDNLLQKVTLYNSLGVKVIETKTTPGSLNISHLQNGIYTLILKYNEGVITKKLVKK